MSRIDLTPPETTVIGQPPRIPRSADSSNVSLGVAVNAADPSGGEHADAGLRGEQRGGGDGRAAGRALRHRHRQVSGAELQRARRRRQLLELVGLEADVRDTVEHRDRRGHGAVLGDRPLELERRPDVLGARQAVRDDRRLERDDRLAVAERAGDALGENDSSGHAANLPYVSTTHA